MATMRALVGLSALLAMNSAVVINTQQRFPSTNNGTHHFTNSIKHTEIRAYPLNRPGHNRSPKTPYCDEECKQPSKHSRMEKVMKEKIRQHAECAAADMCPINRHFKGATKCVDGKAGPYDCKGIDLQSFVPIAELGSTYDASDSWGWTDPDTGDEIAIIGMMDSTAFVQITDPENPIVLGNLYQTGENNRIWVDMKVYSNHVYIIRESTNHGLQVFDLTKLRQYYGVPSAHVRELTQDGYYDGVTSTHNIVINEETAFAYLVGTKFCRGGLHAVDLKDPKNPTYAGCFDNDGYTHDAQCVIYEGPDTRHTRREICFAYNEDTLTIVDVSDKSDMRQISRISYDNAFYTHQGWLTDDMAYLMMNDELDESNGPNPYTRTLLWDVTDLANPVLTGSHYAEMKSIDHNLYIRGDKGYLTNYCSGLRVLDSTQIANGKAPELAFFDVADYCDTVEFKGAWSNYPYFASKNIVVSSIELGLFVLKLQPSVEVNEQPVM